MSVGASTTYAANAYLPPALYTGSSLTLSGTATIAGPTTGIPPLPTAALYVKGKLTNSGKGSLLTVAKVLGSDVPPMSVFMPDTRIAAIIAASLPPQPSPNATWTSRTISTGGTQEFDNVLVKGSLTIAGSGTYRFNSLNVTGSVLIKNTSATVTITHSLRVGGSFTVTAAKSINLGPTNVAGSVGLTGSGTWDIGVLVTNGSLTLGGSQSIGSTSKPVTMLTTGPSTSGLTYGSTGTVSGLLCNRYGSFTQTAGKIVGSVLCNTPATMKNASRIDFNAGAARVILDTTPPTTTAQPGATPNEAGWYNTLVPVTFAATDGTGSGVALTRYQIDGQPPLGNLYSVPVYIGDGIHTVTYWSQDVAGNVEAKQTITLKVDTKAPVVTLALCPAPTNGVSYYNQPVLKFGATDPNGSSGSGVAPGSLQVADDGQTRTDATPDQPLPLSNGEHHLTATAVDLAGNVGSADPLTFTVEPPPFEVVYDAYPAEGDVVGLYADDTAKTGNPDGSWEGKTWEWVVSVEDEQHQLKPQLTFNEPVGFLALADRGPYHVQLTVTDGTTHAKCVTSQTIEARAQEPWADALNVEVLAGQPARLVARFLDPGWEQTHTATWSVTGIDGAIGATVLEDNFPAMDSGYAEGTTPPIPANATGYQGTLAVADSWGDTVDSVPFTITLVEPNPNIDENSPGSDTITGNQDSPVVKGGNVHLSYIQSEGDVDIFEVRTSDDEPLPYGAEVLVTLLDLPADYDVALIQDLGDEVNPEANSLEGATFSDGSAYSWVDAPVRRGADWTGLPVRRGAEWEDVPVRRGADYEGLPVRRGADWTDLPVRRGADLYGLPVRRGAPFIDSAYFDSPVRRGADWQAIPVRRGAGWEQVPVRRGAEYIREPLDTMYFTLLSDDKRSLDGYSFLDMGFTGLGSNTASGSSMTLSELGFSNEALAGLRIADFSAHIGTGMETVWARTDYANSRTYIAVKGANGAFSAAEPYALQVEVSRPLSVYDDLVADQLPVVDQEHQAPRDTPVTQPEGTGPLTLFVTQGQRINALYGDGTWEDTTAGRPFEHVVLPALQAACNDPNGLVRGEVISVASDIFNTWDAAPWMTTEANEVARQVRAEIKTYLSAHPTVKYVVIVGSDEVIPFHRAPDQTVLANEADYYKRSWLKAKGSVAASMWDGTVLTDDYFVDTQSVGANVRSLRLPDVAVARLVETPQEIADTIQQFLDSNGILSGGSSVVTGQDFMADGAARVQTILTDAGLAPKSPDHDPWIANDVRQDLFAAARSVGNVNGHYLHYGGVSAYGYDRSVANLDWTGEFLSSKEIANTALYRDFTGKLVFTMGCHAGLSVPDDQGAVSDDYTGDPDPRLDLAQAVAQRQGVLVASTGYGYGDSEGIAGTEALIGTFANQLTTAYDSAATRGQPIGLALAEAKRQYLGSLSTITPYDEKSSIQFAMYGMPQYRLACTTHAPVEYSDIVGLLNPASAGVSYGFPDTSFTLTVKDESRPEWSKSVTLKEESSNAKARVITADGDSQATPPRPIQPRVVVDIGQTGDDPVKAAIITGGTYVDYPGFNPAISRWTYEWEVDFDESQVWTDGWWPAKPVTVRTITKVEGTQQRLIVLPAQFLAETGGKDGITGTERVWTSLNVKLVRGPETDNIPPTVRSVTLTNQGDQWTATLDAEDSSGIASMDVTQIGVGNAVPKPFDPVSPTTPGGHIYELNFSLPGVDSKDVTVMVAVKDGAGNVTTATAKGLLISGPPEGTVTLNRGAPTAYSPLVTLDSNVVHATEMRVSTDGTRWTTWGPFAARTVVALPDGPGPKAVWAQYRNAQPTVLEVSADVTLATPPVSTGEYHTLAQDSLGHLWAWGQNSSGELGGNGTSPSSIPLQIGSGSNWAIVSAGEGHSLAIQDDGHLWAWGNNYYGQLGDSTHTNSLTPKEVSTEQWAAVSAGRAFSIAIKADGTLWAWGANGLGQLGDDTLVDRDPKQIADGTGGGWVAVSAGYSHSLALRADGSLWAWGNGLNGALGDGTTNSHLTPTRIGTGNDWVAVSAGQSHSMALKADGSLWTWGINEGRLGDGTVENHYSPTCIEPDSVWTAISAGGSQSLALKADGSLWSWGVNYYGEVGDGTTARRLEPYNIDGEWIAVTCRSLHSMALRADGTLWAWGWNEYYQLGDGTNADSRVPKQVLSLGVTELVSAGAPQQASAAWWDTPSVSADGRYVAFTSEAANLVPGDTNGAADVFVHDRVTGMTERVSVASSGAEANGMSEWPSISADGRYVVFTSAASNLVADDTNPLEDIFVHDRQTGTTELISVASDGTRANEESYSSSISADGQYVVFSSVASNLVSGDLNLADDIFLRDRTAGTTTLVTVASDGTGQADGSSRNPVIGADGTCVAFWSSATNLVVGDTNTVEDIFVRDLSSPTAELVTVASDGVNPADNGSSWPSISADGRYVAFQSWASNLVLGDTNTTSDIFVRDRDNGTTERVSVATDGGEATGLSDVGAISADGQYVAFSSYATDLVTGDNNGCVDIFVHDRVTGATSLASVAGDGAQGNQQSPYLSISGDGRYVAFLSAATNLVASDTNDAEDVFVRDRQSDTTDRVSVSSGGPVANSDSQETAVSADGRYVAFTSFASNLVPRDTNGVRDIFVLDRQTGAIERVSLRSDGGQANDSSDSVSISDDGRYVAFQSLATNLVTPDAMAGADVFVFDRGTDQVTRVNVTSDGTQANSNGEFASISGDGSCVVFTSHADNLVPEDTNGLEDAFVHEMSGATERVSVADNEAQGNDLAWDCSISSDGRFVAFSSLASNLADGDLNGLMDVFVRDRQLETTELASVPNAGSAPSTIGSVFCSISDDGRFVAFDSRANLVPGDTGSSWDVYVRDRQLGITALVSATDDGSPGNNSSLYSSISTDGRYIVFGSAASDLVLGDTNDSGDVFVRDLLAGTTQRLSVNSSGVQGNGDSGSASISPDGRYVSFGSFASNLAAGDVNGTADVFIRARW